MKIRLGDIAYARSGDKGAGANIGVIALAPDSYAILEKHLSANVVALFFSKLNPGRVIRYELPNMGALNFVLPTILEGGGSVSLRSDAQGKALASALLEMQLDFTDLHDALVRTAVE